MLKKRRRSSLKNQVIVKTERKEGAVRAWHITQFSLSEIFAITVLKVTVKQLRQPSAEALRIVNTV